MSATEQASAADGRARIPLSRERVLAKAVQIADDEGLDAVTMRHLAEELGVEAMSLYHHVKNKDAVLDGMVDVIVGEIMAELADVDLPDPAEDWRGALRGTILTARRVLLRHPWSPPVLETRTTMSMTIIGYFEGVLGIFRAGGFSWDLAHHAMHALGSRAIGFAQEMFVPDEGDDSADDTDMLMQMGEHFPNLTGMLAAIVHDDPEDETLGWCDDQTEFEFSIDVLFDGLEVRRAREAADA